MKYFLLIGILCLSCQKKQRTHTQSEVIQVNSNTIHNELGKVKMTPKDTFFIRGKDTVTITELETYKYLYGNDTLTKYTYIGYYKKDILNPNTEYESKYMIPARSFSYVKGILRFETFYFPEKDSIIYDRDTSQCLELHIYYDEKGRISSKFCQGTVVNESTNTGFAVGTAFDYKNGKLIKTEYYHNAKHDDDYIIHTFYDENEKVKEIVYTNNYLLYENDSIFLSPKEVKRRVKPYTKASSNFRK